MSTATATRRPAYSDWAPGEPLAASGFDVVEPKADGLWGRVEIDGAAVVVYSRHGSRKASFTLSRPLSAGSAVLHGEYMHGTAWSKARGLTGQILAFDLERIGGDDLTRRPHRHRRARLERVVVELAATSGGRIECLPSWRATSGGLDTLARESWDRWVLADGWEGLVFKSAGGIFGETWGRAKRVFEVDYVCTGFEQSDADRHRGRAVRSMVGGLYSGRTLRDVVRVSGMTDEERRAMFNHPDRFVGRVFRASGFGVFKSGALRHPNFLEWHADKASSECTLRAARSEVTI